MDKLVQRVPHVKQLPVEFVVDMISCLQSTPGFCEKEFSIEEFFVNVDWSLMALGVYSMRRRDRQWGNITGHQMDKVLLLQNRHQNTHEPQFKSLLGMISYWSNVERPNCLQLRRWKAAGSNAEKKTPVKRKQIPCWKVKSISTSKLFTRVHSRATLEKRILDGRWWECDLTGKKTAKFGGLWQQVQNIS